MLLASGRRLEVNAMANSKRRLLETASVPQEDEQTNAHPDEIPYELIACRAYEKWQQRGCPLWDDGQDWFAACAELEEERGVRSESEPSGAPEHAA